MTPPGRSLDALATAIRACRICRDAPIHGPPLPHEPRPILQVSATARVCIASQAPGTRAHAIGRPFDDRSGVRLREWLDLDEDTFYDASRIAIVPMGFCFPGLGPDGGDLPPRRECALTWHHRLFARLGQLELLLVVGSHAHRWHFGPAMARQGVDETVRRWREVYRAGAPVRRLPLPHPSWRNTAWLRRNPWFEADLLPVLRTDLHGVLAGSGAGAAPATRG